MIQANSTSNRKPRYTSPNTSDILLRIPVTRAPTDPNQIIAYRNENLEQTKRVYFGPIKLTKLNVRLLNDKGFEVNLNDRDCFEILQKDFININDDNMNPQIMDWPFSHIRIHLPHQHINMLNMETLLQTNHAVMRMVWISGLNIRQNRYN